MNPREYMKRVSLTMELKQALSPKQIKEAQPFLENSCDFIANRLVEEGYEDMCPEAVKIAERLVSFILVFIQHANNPALTLKMESQLGSA